MLQTTSLKIKTPRFEFQERRLSNFIPTGSAPEKNQFAAVFAGMTATKCACPTLFSAKGAVSFQPGATPGQRPRKTPNHINQG
jgi:hypothetical protein